MYKVTKGVSTIYRWFYGPVIINNDSRDEIYQKLGELLLGLKGKVIGSIHPLDMQESVLDQMSFRKQQWGTFLIDLREDKEKLWSMVDRKSARAMVNKAKEKGVTVNVVTEKDLKEFYDLFIESRTMSNVPLNFYYEDIYEWYILKEAGVIGLLARKDGIPLAASFISTFNNYILESAVCRSRYDAQKQLYGSDLIKWYIIEWGHEHKCDYYDLAGVNPTPSDSKEKGIYGYKSKWGGKFMQYTIYQR